MPETLVNHKKKISAQELSRKQAIDKMNRLGKTKTPFFFITSFDSARTILIERPLSDTQAKILFAFPDQCNHGTLPDSHNSTTLFFEPPSLEHYTSRFKHIHHELKKGNIYLLNLTQSTPIYCRASLSEIYSQATAKYKVYYPGHFVVFSPETFVRIQNGKIFTYPMKGTLRAETPFSKQNLRDDLKEQAEHASVVDLLRNDLGQVASSVQVNKYRYFEKVNAGKYDLWQASSEIEGTLLPDYTASIGDLIFTLLPAGSITGVPKKNAVSIIEEVEDHDRGFYTGICGYFDGKDLDSGVMIRFIEQTSKGMVYKSGGGIHQMSDVEKEYQELIEKIYVPVH